MAPELGTIKLSLDALIMTPLKGTMTTYLLVMAPIGAYFIDGFYGAYLYAMAPTSGDIFNILGAMTHAY